MSYAGWWTRVGAYVLDLVVLGLILFVFAIAGAFTTRPLRRSS